LTRFLLFSPSLSILSRFSLLLSLPLDYTLPKQLIMSSSDEEAVRRPGRATSANGLQSPAPSDRDSAAGNQSPYGAAGNQMDEDNDADLFGSDGSEGGLDNIEYVIFKDDKCA
jgi:hypothetical protein